jgi:hypothetical protein
MIRTGWKIYRLYYSGSPLVLNADWLLVFTRVWREPMIRTGWKINRLHYPVSPLVLNADWFLVFSRE